MLRFFRHIRKTLLEQNKVRTYILYAIGEIMLVVIGILIALQINNWNEEKNGRELEQVYLQNLLTDLGDQLIEIDRHRNGVLSIKEALKRVNEDINSGFTNPDIIQYNKDMQTIVITRTLNMYDATFEDLKSTGNLNLISNDELKQEILNYFQSNERNVYVVRKNAEGFHHALIQDFMGSELVNFDIQGLSPRIPRLDDATGKPINFEFLNYSSDKNKSLNASLEQRLKSESAQQRIRNLITNRWWGNEIALLFLNGMETRTNELISEIQREMR